MNVFLKIALPLLIVSFAPTLSFAETSNKSVVSIGSFTFYGEVPEHFLQNIQKIALTLTLVRKMVDSQSKIYPFMTLRVYFVPFTEDGRKDYPLLARYQKDLLHLHGRSRRYYQAFTEGVSYAELDNVVQLNPAVFSGRYHQLFFQVGEFVIVGHGVMRFFHEYIHVLYTWLGIPSRLHHCMMIRRGEDGLSLNRRVGFLLDKAGLASQTVYLKMVTKSTRGQCFLHTYAQTTR